MCVCVCHSVCESMRDGSIPLGCASRGFPPSFQVSFVALDGLLDAQEEGRVPLVQAGDGVELLHLGDPNREDALEMTRRTILLYTYKDKYISDRQLC